MNPSKLLARVRWGETTLDALVSEGRRLPLSAELSAGAADLWLTSPSDDGATLHVPPGARAVRQRGEAAEVLAPGDHALAIGDRATIDFGQLSFDLGWTTAAGALSGERAADADYLRVLGMTAVMHGVLVAAALSTPRISGLEGGIGRHVPPFITTVYVPEKPKPKAPRLALDARAPRPEGEAGPRDRPKQRSAAPKDVRNTGLLAWLGASKSMAASSVLSRGGLATGLAEAMAGLDGPRAADAGGMGGMGARGPGPGGGGPVDIGQFGVGPGGRPGGNGDIELGRGRGPRGPTVSSGPRILVANISREEIGRVIRRNLARFKYCYERELAASPNLSGKVSVRFTIAPTGRVADAHVDESSIDDTTVEGCVVRVMESLAFPAPRGGGVAMVTYPFVFASAGG